MSSIKDFAKEQSLKKYPVNGAHTEIYQKGIIVGANWQKKQMMSEAIDAELCSDGMFTPLISVKDKGKISNIKFGDKVKLVIIKENYE